VVYESLRGGRTAGYFGQTKMLKKRLNESNTLINLSGGLRRDLKSTQKKFGRRGKRGFAKRILGRIWGGNFANLIPRL